MNRMQCLLAATASLLGTTAGAYELRSRFSSASPIPDPVVDGVVEIGPGQSLRLRVQFGVFDGPDGDPAPAGGIIGWSEGTLEQQGGAATRTPGRLPPFNFSSHPHANGNPPLPAGDPFTRLTEIEATLGTQTRLWHDGEPFPAPVVRGLNTFASVFEFTLMVPPDATENFTVDVGGHILAAASWEVVQQQAPEMDTPGYVLYSPIFEPPVAFTASLLVVVPGPGAGAALAVMVGAGACGRRRRSHARTASTDAAMRS